MLKSECLPSFNNSGKSAVFAGSNDFAWFKLNWGAAVAAPDFLGYRIHCYAFKCSRFKISLATITPEAEA